MCRQGLLISVLVVVLQIAYGQIGMHEDSIKYNEKISPKLTVEFMQTDLLFSNSYKVHKFVNKVGDSKIIDWDKLYEVSDNTNNIFAYSNVKPISVGIQIKNLNIKLGLGLRSEGYVQFPLSTVQLLTQGNHSFDGDDANLEMTSGFTSWHEFLLGGSYTFNDLEFGATIKIADAYQHINTQGGFGIQTSDDLTTITFDRDFDMYSMSILSYRNIDTIYTNFIFPFENISFDNVGLLFDVFAKYRYGAHTMGVFIGDIGKINWKENTVQHYTSKGQEEFTGIDISESITEGISIDLQDTLNNILDISSTNATGYSSSITGKLGLNYRYDSDRFYSGLDFKYFFSGDFNYYYASLKAGKLVKDWLDLFVMYTIDSNSYDNIGAGFALNLRQYRFHLMSRNLPALASPYDFRLLNLQLGMEFKF